MPVAQGSFAACRARVDDAEQHGKQRAHRDAENQHTETQPRVGLHPAGEQLSAVLMHAMSILDVDSTVLKGDRAAN